ncbi:DUF2867 domain-containing protein [Pseudomonas chlororaphis]|uniref:DUF2867 domain-containing protein n=1 Tax=Pseudomonas chlororaphis TaxID=587753 RepID=UPI0015DD77A0|nr:DUF2867 domain-containing protein [Pseudomonas chlororaphis]QLL15692.1 DUF2867 domain-containing protein [Pseudomonas chlororaphis subsp. aurantiaca]
MKSSVSRCSLPPGSSIARHAPGASFIDCQRTLAVDRERSALRHALRLMARTPAWIDHLMSLRNRLVQPFGLKDLGRLTRIDLERQDDDYQPGDRVGIFTLVSQTPDEVLLVDQDRHLDVYLAINRLPLDAQGERPVVLSTLVHPHNRLGRLYMLPVAPFHRFIAPRMLAMLNQR